MFRLIIKCSFKYFHQIEILRTLNLDHCVLMQRIKFWISKKFPQLNFCNFILTRYKSSLIEFVRRFLKMSFLVNICNFYFILLYTLILILFLTLVLFFRYFSSARDKDKKKWLLSRIKMSLINNSQQRNK